MQQTIFSRQKNIGTIRVKPSFHGKILQLHVIMSLQNKDSTMTIPGSDISQAKISLFSLGKKLYVHEVIETGLLQIQTVPFSDISCNVKPIF